MVDQATKKHVVDAVLRDGGRSVERTIPCKR